jgi:hypothetical protein
MVVSASIYIDKNGFVPDLSNREIQEVENEECRRCIGGATTLSITTFSMMTLSIKGLFVTLSINDIQQKRHSA